MADKVNLTKSLEDLNTIAEWFDSQEAVDVEEGLTKVKQAAKLIKDSKARLAEIENEFQEIEKEISDESSEEQSEEPGPVVVKRENTRKDTSDETVNLEDIPF